jgi:hypothetical protein
MCELCAWTYTEETILIKPETRETTARIRHPDTIKYK